MRLVVQSVTAASVTVDGKAIEGNVLPVFGDGKTHAVTVVMG